MMNKKKMLFENIKDNQFRLLKESIVNLEHLYGNISNSTMTGKYFRNFISSLESLIEVTQDFKGEFSSTLHGPLPNTAEGERILGEIVKLCNSLKPIILGMNDIEKKDMWSGRH